MYHSPSIGRDEKLVHNSGR